MAETIMLKVRMGTRFMINSLNLRLTRILEECKENGNTLDLNGCRFGPTCATLLSRYYSTVDLCNSESVYLDGILKNNCLAARATYDEYESLDLRNASELNTYLRLAEELPAGACYKPDMALSDPWSRATLILLIMTRPDIEFDIRSCGADVFEFVRDAWLSSAEHHEMYYERVGVDITVRQVTSDGLYGDEYSGFKNERDFIHERKVLPYEFGNSQIIKLSKDDRVSDEWLPVVQKCLDLFQHTAEAQRVPGKTVKDFLTFREVN
jgi:hypothetical protein